jgi:hypothetical protein
MRGESGGDRSYDGLGAFQYLPTRSPALHKLAGRGVPNWEYCGSLWIFPLTGDNAAWAAAYVRRGEKLARRRKVAAGTRTEGVHISGGANRHRLGMRTAAERHVDHGPVHEMVEARRGIFSR